MQLYGRALLPARSAVHAVCRRRLVVFCAALGRAPNAVVAAIYRPQFIGCTRAFVTACHGCAGPRCWSCGTTAGLAGSINTHLFHFSTIIHRENAAAHSDMPVQTVLQAARYNGSALHRQLSLKPPAPTPSTQNGCRR